LMASPVMQISNFLSWRIEHLTSQGGEPLPTDHWDLTESRHMKEMARERTRAICAIAGRVSAFQ
jgi:hypothetical protein